MTSWPSHRESPDSFYFYVVSNCTSVFTDNTSSGFSNRFLNAVDLTNYECGLAEIYYEDTFSGKVKKTKKTIPKVTPPGVPEIIIEEKEYLRQKLSRLRVALDLVCLWLLWKGSLMTRKLELKDCRSN
jgi:hypothetical protein